MIETNVKFDDEEYNSQKDKPTLPINSMFQIKDALLYVRNQIEPKNELIKRINQDKKKDCSKHPIINSLKDYFPYELILHNSLFCERIVFDCLTLIQSNFESNTGENLYFSNFIKYRLYLQIIGSISKLYGLIDTFDKKIDNKTQDKTYVKKLFSSIFTDLARLLPTISDSDKDLTANKVLSLLYKLNNSDKENIIVTCWESKFALELEDDKALKSLRYLLVDSDISLDNNELMIQFNRLKEENRIIFIKNLVDVLLPNEKRELIQKLGV